METPSPIPLEDAAPRNGSAIRPASSPTGTDLPVTPERLESIINALGVGFWDFEVASGAFWRSSHCDRILGVREQLPKWSLATFLERILAVDRAAVEHAFRRAIREGSEWATECRIQGRDGEIHWIAIQGQTHRGGQNEVVRLVGWIRDTTSQKRTLLQLSQARRAAEAVSKAEHSLLATLGKHLCCSLDSLLDACGRWTIPDGEGLGAAGSLSVIQANGQTLAELLNGIVAFIRDEGGIYGGRLSLEERAAAFAGLGDSLPEPQAAAGQTWSGSAAADAQASPAVESRPARVLLVDDVPSVRSVHGEHLKRLGIEVDEADDGKSGCEMALRSRVEGRPYGLILMDLIMPVMSGVQAALELRRQGWGGPIVALTAHALEGDRERCLEAGCDDCLAKPVAGKQLALVARRYLGGRPGEPLAVP